MAKKKEELEKVKEEIKETKKKTETKKKAETIEKKEKAKVEKETKKKEKAVDTANAEKDAKKPAKTVKAEKNTKKAEIKYFSSHTDYRFMGIAFDLLSYALQYTFSNYDVDKIYFKIRSKNNTLVERFHELGFNINYEYKKFKYVAAHIG